MEKRLSDALSLAVLNLANSNSMSKGKATIDAYQGVYILPMTERVKGLLYIHSAWASALLVLH